MKEIADPDTCIGCELCPTICPEFFRWVMMVWHMQSLIICTELTLPVKQLKAARFRL